MKKTWTKIALATALVLGLHAHAQNPIIEVEIVEGVYNIKIESADQLSSEELSKALKDALSAAQAQQSEQAQQLNPAQVDSLKNYIEKNGEKNIVITRDKTFEMKVDTTDENFNELNLKIKAPKKEAKAEAKAEEKKRRKSMGYSDFNFGLNTLLNSDFQQQDLYESRTWRSWNFEFGVGGARRFGRSAFGFKSGLHHNWNGFGIRTPDVQIINTPEGIVFEQDGSGNELAKSRFRVRSLDVPLMLFFDPSKNGYRTSFNMALGGFIGWRYSTRSIIEYLDHNRNSVYIETVNDFNVNPLKYGLRMEIGFDEFHVVASYELSNFFNNKANLPNLNMASLAIGWTL